MKSARMPRDGASVAMAPGGVAPVDAVPVDAVPVDVSPGGVPSPGGAPNAWPTAAALGVRGCHACRLVFDAMPGEDDVHCPRCDTVSHHRHPASLQRTWAWLATATLAYIPANTYPVFSSTTFGLEEGHTIIGGVIELAGGGSWDLAIIVFVASVIVPIVKISALALLAWLAGRRAPTACGHERHRQRARLYRFIEAIGQWSMLDIFVVALLVALVQFGQVMTIQPGIGAVAFGVVVVATLYAASAFDPRLLWDRLDASAASPSSP